MSALTELLSLKEQIDTWLRDCAERTGELVSLKDRVDVMLARCREKKGVLVVDDRLVSTVARVLDAVNADVHVIYMPAGDHGALVKYAKGRHLRYLGWMLNAEDAIDVVCMANAIDAARLVCKMPPHVDVLCGDTPRTRDVARVLSAAVGMKVVMREHDDTYLSTPVAVREDRAPCGADPLAAWEGLQRLCEWTDDRDATALSRNAAITRNAAISRDADTVLRALRAFGGRWPHPPELAVVALDVHAHRSVPMGTAVRLLQLDASGELRLRGRIRAELAESCSKIWV